MPCKPPVLTGRKNITLITHDNENHKTAFAQKKTLLLCRRVVIHSTTQRGMFYFLFLKTDFLIRVYQVYISEFILLSLLWSIIVIERKFMKVMQYLKLLKQQLTWDYTRLITWCRHQYMFLKVLILKLQCLSVCFMALCNYLWKSFTYKYYSCMSFFDFTHENRLVGWCTKKELSRLLFRHVFFLPQTIWVKVIFPWKCQFKSQWCHLCQRTKKQPWW